MDRSNAGSLFPNFKNLVNNGNSTERENDAIAIGQFLLRAYVDRGNQGAMWSELGQLLGQ